jgi:hypothetical protein
MQGCALSCAEAMSYRHWGSRRKASAYSRFGTMKRQGTWSLRPSFTYTSPSPNLHPSSFFSTPSGNIAETDDDLCSMRTVLAVKP